MYRSTEFNIMKYISEQDYIIFDETLQQPVEKLDIVYHYTTVVEIINDGFVLKPNEKFVCIAQLPLYCQKKISEAIELTK